MREEHMYVLETKTFKELTCISFLPLLFTEEEKIEFEENLIKKFYMSLEFRLATELELNVGITKRECYEIQRSNN